MSIPTAREKRVIKHAQDNGYINTRYVREADLLEHCKTVLGMLGALVVREDHVSVNGVADLIFCYNGCFCAAELKSIEGKPSMTQLLFIQKVKKAKGYAAVCQTVGELLSLALSTPHFVEDDKDSQK